MAIIKYRLYKFDKNEASSGKLCVCVLNTIVPIDDPTDPSYPTTIMSSGEGSTGFIGAGLSVYKDYKFNLTINSKLYVFNDKGLPVNSIAAEANSILVLGEIDNNVIGAGSTIKAYNTATVTRSDSGISDPTIQYNNNGENILIDTLNARDHFAIQALQMLLARMEKDPATISDSEMGQLSDVAYRYAANMMMAAANARADITDTSTPTENHEESVTQLETNTEKLLNNLIVALEKTDADITVDDNTVKAERITNPQLLNWLDAYADNGETGEAHGKLGLKDLIDAISQGGGGGGTGSTVQIGDEGLGRNRANPFFISNSDESKYVPYAIYQYRSKGEAESDGWEFDSADNVWKKAYYNDVPGSYTDESAKLLPTWKNVVKVSIVEMADLIAAVNNVADAIRNQ